MKNLRVPVVGALAALTLALSACGGGSDADKSEGGSGSAGEIDRSATLRATWVIPAMALDPHTAPSPTAQYAYVAPVYDRLTQMIEGEKGPEIAPMIAESWEFAEDGMSATFTLRDDATFTDDSKVDAAAVKASLDRALNSPKSTVKGYLSMIDKVEVVDPTTLTITTNRPSADLPYVLSNSYGSIINPAALDNRDLDVKPQGSGGYVATKVELGKGVTYERRDGYWDTEAQKVAKIEMSGVPDPNARINGMRGGQADFSLVQPQQYDAVSKLGDGFKLETYSPTGQFYALELNTNAPNLNKVEVRQALNYAIDREGISESLLDGQAPDAIQPLSKNLEGHLEDPPVKYEYDPAKAKAMLADAGLADGFSMTMVAGAYSPVTEMAQALQAQLAEVGVELKISPLDPVQAVAAWGPDTKYDSTLQVRVGSQTGALTLQNNYLVPTRFVGEVPAEVRKSIDGAFDPTIDDAERVALLETASKAINEQALDVFMNQVPSLVVTTDKVVGADKMGQAGFQGIFDLRYVGIAK
ncbi:ABC transporter substrate-binding protein [Aeromicrobium sp. SMF47]|uniref:ABC transporter substrate-binding protein n=1 Tax=Aeromicrobium TaxID=2040 RepID=UPI00129DE90A|nr:MULTISPECIES: ABC transporter substrate-binding protein [Aeromicrobium]MRJ77333.1 ABC transporter substrate-binding protein [Aeromicrobium yanjiei]MRK01701.1 ABC transporter substrate-binding protein [Aeromicrobium sp. S22]